MYSYMMKTMFKVLFVICLLHFSAHFRSASAEMKRSIVNGQDAAMLLGRMFAICDKYKDLNSRQRAMCKRDFHEIGSVIEGARLAQNECTKQFNNEHWDCSLTLGTHEILGLMKNYGTKEAAFNYALVAAGIVHVMARNCMKGDLLSCHCSKAKRPRTGMLKSNIWGGCGDNILYAVDFSRRFFNDPAVEKLNGSTNTKRSEKLLMDHHNMEVGRQVVLKKRKIICKCHGATNHCSAKTCWYQVEKFHVIGDTLRKKYDSAIKASLTKRRLGKKVALKAKNHDVSSKHKNDLVYTEDSPPYCKNQGNYYASTTGRLCNKATTGPGSCDYFCCGRSFKTTRRKVSRKCRCKFHWCCDVKCDQCEEEILEHRCR